MSSHDFMAELGLSDTNSGAATGPFLEASGEGEPAGGDLLGPEYDIASGKIDALEDDPADA